MHIVDSHCHIIHNSKESSDYGSDAFIVKLINDSIFNNVKTLLNISLNPYDFERDINLSNTHKGIYTSLGIHPYSANDSNIKDVDLISKYISNEKIIAIGECGLDYYRTNDNQSINRQKDIFIAQLDLAAKYDIPAIVHTRYAAKDTIDLIKISNCRKGIIHCFSEGINFAQKALDLGFYLSFSGLLTKKTSTQIHNVVKYAPHNRMLVETDSPYLIPYGVKERCNTPKNTYYVVEYLAQLLKLDIEEVANGTTENFKALFNLDSLETLSTYQEND